MALTVSVGDKVVRWELAGSVLAQGITDPADESDICLWSLVTNEGRAVVVMSLGAAHGEQVVDVCTNRLFRFLTCTLGLVPLGSESAWLDVDAVVEQLRGSGTQ